MKALILAAGFGSRLKDFTKDKPKCLVEVKGKPILKHQLKALKSNGILDIVIVSGYKEDVLINYLNSDHFFNDFNIKVISNKRYNNSNSSYSFWVSRKELIDEESYLHLNCDIIFSSELLKKVITSEHKNVIAIDNKVELKSNMELVELERDKIIKMDNIFYPEATAKAFGLAKLSKSCFDKILYKLETYVKSGDFNQNFYGIIRKIVDSEGIYSIKSNEDLFEVNTVNDLEYVSNKLQ